MFKKCLSVVLALIILLSVLAVSSVSVTAQVVDTIDEGANLELASTGNPYGKWQDTEYPDGDGYYEIRCTWFAWQKAYDVCGVELPAWGNGNSWYASAQAANIPTGTVPRVNSIACFNSGYYGHVSFVTAVHDDNTMTVEEGGRTDLDHTASQGVGTSRPSSVVGVGGLQGFIYLGNSDTHYGAEIVNFDGANASNVSFFDATIGCWMRNPNSYNIRSYGFYLGNNQNELVQYTIGQNVKWTDSYIQANLSDYVGRLSQGVTYYYRFFSLTDGYNLSPVYSFSTAGNSTVTFNNVVSSNIDNDNMSIECWVRNHQGLNINKYGLYYGTSVNGMNECIEVGSNVSWTDFHISIKIIDQNIELKPNTTYYYQFFALTDGWNFSNVSSFTTGNYVPRKYSEFDVNFWVDGKNIVNIDGIGEIQVYVNGQLQGYGTDFCKNVPQGKPYEVKINITNTDYHFAGVDTSVDGYFGLTGTTSSSAIKVRLVICKDTDGINSIPNGNYVIASALNTAHGLDIAGDDLPAQNNANVGLWPIGDTIRPQDTFTLTNLGNGYYSIKQLGAEMAVDVTGASPNAQTNIQMFESNNNDNQQWKICYDSSINAYTLQAKCSGMYLTVQGGTVINGSNVYQNIKSTIPEAQGWLFIPYNITTPTEPITSKLGDVDGDGEVTIIDATCIQRKLASIPTAKYIESAADTDGDGEVTIIDATAIQRHLVQLPAPDRIGKPIK